MSRPLRIEYTGAFYHITSRGNAKNDIFSDDKDFSRFLYYLGREIEQQKWHCYAYCLMNNHYHLLLETPEANLVKGMTRLNGSYTQYFNRRHQRVGHLFQGRYKSIIVDKDNYLLELCRYVVLNPVRANMVKNPVQWKWSSYGVTIGKENYPDWFDIKLVLNHFSKARRSGIQNYRIFVSDGIGEESPFDNLMGQIWLGGEEFINRIEKKVNKSESKEIPYEQRKPLRPKTEDIIKQVADLYDVSEKEIIGRENKEAYRSAVYLLRRAVNLGVKEVSEMFEISEGMVSKIQRIVDKGKTENKKIKTIFKKYKVQT